ncbi:MAG: DUF4932 domain-containing protein [Cyclobacteriaceae bacterium]|nr:DUF4932 domain-containing protein [Cyclobacteriaceae bacterium HetDA_MAG_MS6]
MNNEDRIIKEALGQKLTSIKDPEFTKRIVEIHTSNMEEKYAHFLDFGSLTLGIIGTLLAFAVSVANSIYKIGLTETQLMIIQIIPIVYLAYQLLNEFIINKNHISTKSSVSPMSTLLVLLMLALTSPTNAQDLRDCEKFQISLNGEASLSVNPIIEFFEIFNMMAGNPNINEVDAEYKLAALNYFQSYREHPSLNYYRKNFHKFFQSIDAPYPLLYSLGSDFNFREDLIDNKWKYHPEIDTLLSVFRNFSQDTDFSNFFNSAGNYFDILLNSTAYTLSDFNEKERMLNYYGIEEDENHSFHLVLNTLGFGNFGTGIKSKNSEEHYATVSAGRSISGIPIYTKSSLENLIWHEFGHSFTNPLVDKYWSKFEELNHLHPPIKESMAAQAYLEWKSVVYEHMTRALNCRFEAAKYGESYSQLSQERIELGRRFIYVPLIVDQLKIYEQNRGTYRCLDNFITQIINRLSQLTEEEIIGLNEEVDAIRTPNIDDIPENGDFFEMENQLMILSTSEKDSIGDRQLKEYLANQYPNLKTIADTLALKSDLSNFNLFVIGSFDGNEFIRQHINDLPIQMDSAKLIAGKTYHGDGYAYLTGWVHPNNPDKVVTYYIAQNPKDLLNFKWVRRGSTDFHILKNLVTIRADEYRRNMRIWVFP